jgi:uncharacterized protein (TIGR02001 family)
MRKRWLIVFPALLVVVSSLCVVGESGAEDTGPLAAKNFSGSATLTSDYVFRGLSQTDEDPAVQASFDYKHPAGVFLGAWASNVDEAISEGNVEIDFYGGYRGQLFEKLSYELSIIYYWYPGGAHDPDWDFVELHGGLNYAFAGLPLDPNVGLGFNYSPDFYGEDGNAYFFNGTLRLTLPYGLGLGFELGYQDVEGDKLTGNGRGLDGKDGFDYLFWKVGLSKEVVGFSLDLSYYDTSEEQFFGPIGGERAVISISRSF